MAKTTTTKKTNNKVDLKAAIMSAYTKHILEHNAIPNSVYKFCRDEDISEEDFYSHFGHLNAVQNSVWKAFHENTMDVLHKNEAFESYSNREKMLSYYYTFFEVLKLNRSYVLFSLKDHSSQHVLKSLEQLKGVRRCLKAFATQLIQEGNEQKQLKLTKHNATIFSEAAWVQFLFILKYWMDDDSASFDKTDVIIEKSVNTVFDIFETTPLESVIDFGKFLWKEKMM